MIGRWERIIIACLAVAMVVLLLMLFYQNTVAEGQGRILNISVLVESPSDRFRKGLEKAARENNVDMRMITAFESESQEQAIRREIDNRADAIVLKAMDAEGMREYLMQLNRLMPIVTVDEQVQYQSVVTHIGVDERLADMLADTVAGAAEGVPCVIVGNGRETASETERINAVQTALGQRGIRCNVLISAPEDMPAALESGGVIIAMQPELLLAVCEHAGPQARIFGVGYDNSIRDYLESGRIEKLVVYSDFDAGYLCLKAAVQAANGGATEEKDLELYYADGETMYKAPINQILFPIE